MSTDWYAPNQQAVRGDESGPAEEGNGGSPPLPDPEPKLDTGPVDRSVKAADEPATKKPPTK
jgi:hypothetical protein